MKERSYKEMEEFLDGEKTNLKKEEIKGNKMFKETLELFAMLKKLPATPAPHDFETNLYRKLGISYIPVYKKLLSITGLSVFAAAVYLSTYWLLNLLRAKINLVKIPHQISLLYAKIMQFVSLVKAGEHLKDIYFAFTNPWLLLALALVSSFLILILIRLLKEVKKGEAVLRRF